MSSIVLIWDLIAYGLLGIGTAVFMYCVMPPRPDNDEDFECMMFLSILWPVFWVLLAVFAAQVWVLLAVFAAQEQVEKHRDALRQWWARIQLPFWDRLQQATRSKDSQTPAWVHELSKWTGWRYSSLCLVAYPNIVQSMVDIIRQNIREQSWMRRILSPAQLGEADLGSVPLPLRKQVSEQESDGC